MQTSVFNSLDDLLPYLLCVVTENRVVVVFGVFQLESVDVDDLGSPRLESMMGKSRSRQFVATLRQYEESLRTYWRLTHALILDKTVVFVWVLLEYGSVHDLHERGRGLQVGQELLSNTVAVTLM
ncbi:MAG: hypothetical protein ACRDGA_10550 [Bacteroidota bacterium]